MITNVGIVDRIIRLVVGIVLLVAPFLSGMALFASTTATVVSVIIGVVLVATSALKFCPLYRVFGIQTGNS